MTGPQIGQPLAGPQGPSGPAGAPGPGGGSFTLTAAEDIAAGTAVSVNGSGEAVQSGVNPIGITAAGASMGASVTIQNSGTVTGLSGLTASDQYYANADGTLTTTVTNQFIGTATASTKLALGQYGGLPVIPNPITYTGDPTGLSMAITNEAFILNGAWSSGLACSDNSSVAPGLQTLKINTPILTSPTVTPGFAPTLAGLTTFDLSSVAEITCDFGPVLDSLTSIDLSALKIMFGNYYGFSLQSASLDTLDLPAIEYLSLFDTNSMPALANFTLGATLKEIPATAFSMLVTGAALTQASVDGLLASLVALDGTGGTTLFQNASVDLSGGTSSAPSVAGAVNAAILTGRGCSVTTN